MSEGMIAAIAGLAAVVVALAQWFFSSQAASRQRDSEMTSWGGEVIDLMAELETACDPISPDTRYSPPEIEKLSHRASSLVDRGRLFFPNVPSRGTASDDEGIRVRILDQVLLACYAARYLSFAPTSARAVLRAHVWSARRRFVVLLQKEMGQSLRKVAEESAGDHVPRDPRDWAPVPIPPILKP